MKSFLSSASDFVRRAILKWWRPAYYVATVACVIVSGVIVPLMTKTTDNTGLALLVASAAPVAILRTVEKMKGIA